MKDLHVIVLVMMYGLCLLTGTCKRSVTMSISSVFLFAFVGILLVSLILTINFCFDLI